MNGVDVANLSHATPQGGMPPNADQQFFPGSDIRALNYSQADPYIPGNPMGDVDMAYPPYANTQGGMTPNAGGELFAGLKGEVLRALGRDPANQWTYAGVTAHQPPGQINYTGTSSYHTGTSSYHTGASPYHTGTYRPGASSPKLW